MSRSILFLKIEVFLCLTPSVLNKDAGLPVSVGPVYSLFIPTAVNNNIQLNIENVMKCLQKSYPYTVLTKERRSKMKTVRRFSKI